MTAVATEKPTVLPGHWDQADFAPFVDRVLDSLSQPFARRLPLARQLGTVNRLSKKEWRSVRGAGIYFPPGDQLFLAADGIDPTRQVQTASIAFKAPKDCREWGQYCNTLHFTRMRFPPGVKAVTPGTSYRIILSYFRPDGRFMPVKYWVTIDSDGKVCPTEHQITDYSPWGEAQCRTISSGSMEHFEVKFTATWSAHTDRERLWLVRAENATEAAATFGVHVEQVKSLFYARDQPLTKTGRRRPILHWVDAHQRRMKNGTDVVIPAHLRGIEKFSFGDTLFQISSPVKPEQVHRDPGPSPEKHTSPPNTGAMTQRASMKELGLRQRALAWVRKLFAWRHK